MSDINHSNRIWKLVGANAFFLAIICGVFLMGVPDGKIFDSFISDIYSTYSIMALASLLLLDVIFVTEVFIRHGDKKLGDGVLFVSQGELPALAWFNGVSNIKLLFGSICVMSVISLVLFILFGDLGKTVLSQAPLLDTFLILLENVMLAMIFAVEVFVMRMIWRKQDWGSESFQGMVWSVIIITGGAFGYFMHLYSKGGNFGELTYSLIFWAFTGLITLVTGSVFAGTGMHLILDLPFFINSVLSDMWVITIYLLIIVTSGYMAFRLNSKNSAYENKDVLNEGGFYKPDKGSPRGMI